MARFGVSGRSELEEERENGERNASESDKNINTSERCHNKLVRLEMGDHNQELVGEASLSGEVDEDSVECRKSIELVEDTLEDLSVGQVAPEATLVITANGKTGGEKQTVANNKNVVRRAYVETSLDDLSYSSSSESEIEDERQERIEASGQSADEEDEKRLLLHLQNQAKQQEQIRAQRQQQYDHQKRAQEDQIRQQQQFTSQIPVCFHTQQQRQQQQPLLSDDEAPEVPVRRSSATGQLHQQNKHTIRARRMMQAPEAAGLRTSQCKPVQPVALPKIGDRQTGRSQLPRPLSRNPADELAPERWREKGLSAGMVFGRRPTQPPPPPPPPPPPTPPSHAVFSACESPGLEAAYRSALNSKSRAPKNIWSPSTSSNEGGADDNNPEGLSSVFDEEGSLNMAANVAPPTSSSTSGPHRTLAELSFVSATMSPQQETIVERVGRQREVSGSKGKQFTGDDDHDGAVAIDVEATIIHDDNYLDINRESGEVPLEQHELAKVGVAQLSKPEMTARKMTKSKELAQNQQTMNLGGEERDGFDSTDVDRQEMDVVKRKQFVDVQGEQTNADCLDGEQSGELLQELRQVKQQQQNNRNSFLASLNQNEEPRQRARSKNSRSYSIATANLSLAPKPTGYKSILATTESSVRDKYWTLPSSLAVATGGVERERVDSEIGGIKQIATAITKRRVMSSSVEASNQQQLYRLQQEQQKQQCNSSLPRESSLNPAASESELTRQKDINSNFTASSGRDNAVATNVEYSSVVKRSHVDSASPTHDASLTKPGGSKQQRKETADQNMASKSSSFRRNTIQAIQHQRQAEIEAEEEESKRNLEDENMADIYNAAVGDNNSKYATQTKIIVDERMKSKKFYSQNEEEYLIIYNNNNNSLGKNKAGEAVEQQTTSTIGNRDEWFRQMYKKMHKQTPEKSLLQAVNKQQQDTTQIKIKMKSPRTDHRYSPSYFSEEDFERRYDKSSISPTFRPGNICDYLPGQSSINQHEKNLKLYHKLIDHIDRVFSSVLLEANSRSTNTLQAINRQHSSRRKSLQNQQSRSGPQTPVSSRQFYREPLKDEYESKQQRSDHDRKCVFSNLLKEQQEEQTHHLNQHEFEQEIIDDPRKQYVAVQQGQDIPLKGLRKAAPQPNIYKVGPAPPRIFETPKRDNSGKWTTTTPTQAQYRDHLTRLNQILRDEQRMVACPTTTHQRLKVRDTTNSNRSFIKMDSFEDLYKDFDSVYESMCHTATNSQNTPNESIYGGSSTSGKQADNNNNISGVVANWSKVAAFETEALAKSLVEVEEALKRATTSSAEGDKSPTSSILAPEVEPQSTQIPSSQVSPIYGKPISGKNLQLNHLPQPSLSPMLSTATSEQTRAESRNTNQSYQNGPALVEEMTLSDLEDEISLSLMDAKEHQSRNYFSDGEQLMLRTCRSRNPLPTSFLRNLNTSLVNDNNSFGTNRSVINQIQQPRQQQLPNSGYHSSSRRYPRTAQGMYSRARQIHHDESINIHYKVPTSKLLKMNTFNEFELSRIKKLYNDELNSRLQRSKSTRLTAFPNHYHTKRPSQQSQGCYFSEQRRRTQSAERLLPPSSRYFNQRSPDSSYSSPFIDLNRYEHALVSKSAKARHQLARFGRALFNFQAKSERELSLKRGDLVELLELLDHTWARVEDCQSGLQGLVPLNYIDFGVGCAVAKRDVSGQQRVIRTSYGGSSSTSAPQQNKQPLEPSAPILPMNKGEPITLIRRLSGHWYEASNTRQAIGLVWSNDLDIIKQPVLSDKDCRPSEDYHRSTSTRPASRFSVSERVLDDGNDCDADDDDDDDDDEEFSDYEGEVGFGGCTSHHGQEIFMLNSNNTENVTARKRRARSASGLQGQIYYGDGANMNQCCANINNPDLHQQQSNIRSTRGDDIEPTDRCCGHIKANQCAMATGNVQLPRRSSSSPYISSAGQQQQASGVYQEEACQRVKMGAVTDVKETSHLPRLCRAKYPYKAHQKDELDLVVGDILMVVHECDDGWFIGSSYTTKEMGTFPGNFVEPV